ncbi:MAG: hypothetical protein AAFV88_05580 [Planctomycetota bacterium]
MQYLLFTHKLDSRQCIAADVDAPSDYTSDQYGDLQEQFHAQHGSPRDKWYFTTNMVRKFYEGPHGILYDEELAGPDGCSYWVFIRPEHTEQQRRDIVQWLKDEQDVVRMTVWNITKIVEVDLYAVSE